MTRTRLLLVNPRTPPTFWGLEYTLPIANLSTVHCPLGLLTIAALAPQDWDISLVDENVEPADLDQGCDIVGIGAMNNQMQRAFELADGFRKRGRTVVIGGPLAFADAASCAGHADSVVVGEAERTFRRLCSDYADGNLAPLYVENEHVDLELSPVPRFDLLRKNAYASVSIQTTRGCPHSCEFCDIIVMMGRRVRTKPVQQVLAEVEAVRTQNPNDCIFFTDDNFNGNIKYCRALLRGLIELRDSTNYRPLLLTQASVNLAEQTDLLELMVRAGFTRLFLGVETPRQESLREVGKRQNVRGDLVERLATIQRAGIITWAGMIVGFDHDDEEIFAEQAEFLDQAGVAMAMVGMLNALPKTPLYERLKREGRLIEGVDQGDNCAWTNVIPKNMSRAALFRGYADLMSHLYEQRNYTRRMLRNIYRMGPPVKGSSAARLPNWPEFMSLLRAIKAFTFSRRADYRRHFVPNALKVMLTRPSRMVEAVTMLGMWLHFDQYVPEVRQALESALLVDQNRALSAIGEALPGVHVDPAIAVEQLAVAGRQLVVDA